jgi:hypothetical protein
VGLKPCAVAAKSVTEIASRIVIVMFIIIGMVPSKEEKKERWHDLLLFVRFSVVQLQLPPTGLIY